MEVDVFIPCCIDQFNPQIGKNLFTLLQSLDLECYYNQNQTCCGQIAFNAGFWDEAKQLGEKFIKDFSRARMVVSPSESCVRMIKNNYPLMFHNSSKHNELRVLQNNLFEISDFLIHQLKITNFNARFNHRVTIHDLCFTKTNETKADNIRLLLKEVKGIEVIEMPNSSNACGSNGGFSHSNESVSVAMAKNTVENAIAVGAEYIVSLDSSCLLHLNSYILKNNLPVKTIHLLEILVTGLESAE